MKILFVSPHFHSFASSKGGAEQRTYLFIKALTSFAEVDFVSFHDAEGFDVFSNMRVLFNQEITGNSTKTSKFKKWLPVLKFWDLNVLFPKHKQKAEIIQQFIHKNNYDFIFTRYIRSAMEYGLDDYADKLVVDMDDSLPEYFKIITESSNTKSAKIRNIFFSFCGNFNTKKFIRKINTSIFTNACEAEYYGVNHIPNIPFYADTCSPINFANTSKRLFFVGNLSYFPNYSGINYFIENIYTNLKKHLPDIEFYIAGEFSDNELFKKWQTFSGVKLLGKINNLQAEYEQARAVVVPIYQGAGTNIKVIEALQMNRACVLSDVATRGFSRTLEAGKDYLVAKNDSDFVDNLKKILTDEKFNLQIAENGCKKVKKYFSYEVFLEKVMKVFEIYE